MAASTNNLRLRMSYAKLHQIAKKLEFLKDHIHKETPNASEIAKMLSEDLGFPISRLTIARQWAAVFPDVPWPKTSLSKSIARRKQLAFTNPQTLLYLMPFRKMMMESLNKQVGGCHYKVSAMQPVELFFPTSLPFMEGCIVKYICRYDKKNGLEDLQKAEHYVELIKQFRNKNSSILKSIWWEITGHINYFRRNRIVKEFIVKNNLNYPQGQAIKNACYHSNQNDLDTIIACIYDLKKLINKEL